MNKYDKIFIAGHRRRAGYEYIVTCEGGALDLCEQRAVNELFRRHRPKVVFLVGARVMDGIRA